MSFLTLLIVVSLFEFVYNAPTIVYTAFYGSYYIELPVKQFVVQVRHLIIFVIIILMISMNILKDRMKVNGNLTKG